MAIEDLPDSLILEILGRLPTCKFVIQCKIVCKSWLIIISHPSFVPRFISLHDRFPKQVPTALIMDQKVYKYSGEAYEPELLILSQHRPNPKFSLDFLPPFQTGETKESCRSGEEEPTVRVVLATYNDLILCNDKTSYYICNPHTKQYVPVPHPPTKLSKSSIGFICEHKGRNMNDGKYKFCIVHVLHFKGISYKFEVQVFSSESFKWEKSTLSCPQGLRNYRALTRNPGVVYNGMLYWYNVGRGFIGFDPFKSTTCYIDLPAEKLTSIDDDDDDFYFFGVCKGNLRYMNGNTEDVIYIWELKQAVEDDSNIIGQRKYWSLVHHVCCDEIKILDNYLLMNTGDDYEEWWYWAIVYGLHPNNGDILFVEFPSSRVLAVLNLRDKTLGFEMKVKSTRYVVDDRWLWRRNWPFVVQPLWPTPIPQLLEQ